MSGNDWSKAEVEAIIDDYFSMLLSELAGTPYNKAAHRRTLRLSLVNRSDQAIEFKHANISAALLDAGLPYISGYKPRSNYQFLLASVIEEQLCRSPTLLEMAAVDADRPMAVPEVDDILAILIDKPGAAVDRHKATEPAPSIRLTTNYIEREARNRSLGHAGELFTINFERARLIRAGREGLASKIEHTSVVRGDYEGYDVLSFEESGAERLIEVKTTKYGADVPFFVTRNELSKSERCPERYVVYRLFAFRRTPRLFVLPGAIPKTCLLSPATYLATAR